MKKIFSARIFAIALITYLLTFVVFVVGAVTDKGGSFLDMPVVVGFLIAVLYGFPVIVLLTCIYILIKVRPMTLIIGYLILTVGVYGIVYGAIQLNNLSSMRQFQASQAEQSAYFESTIFPEIKKLFPKAEMGVGEGNLPAVKFVGYTYENLPDFDKEKEKLDEFKYNPVLQNQKYNFYILYFCENMEDNFANYRLTYVNDYGWHFKPYAMSNECNNQVIAYLKEYIGDKYVAYKITHEDDKIVVSTNNEISSDEEPAEAEYWQNFFVEKNVNIQLFDIKILYSKAGSNTVTRIYDPFFVEKERWSESDYPDHISYY